MKSYIPIILAIIIISTILGGLILGQDGSLRNAPPGTLGTEMYKVEYAPGNSIFFTNKLNITPNHAIFFDGQSKKWIILPHEGTWVVCLKEPQEFKDWEK